MFKEIDTNGDGKVSFEEFKVAMLKMCTHCKVENETVLEIETHRSHKKS